MITQEHPASLAAPTRLGLKDNGLLMSPVEFDAITEFAEESVFELIHGVVVVTPIPGPGERDPNEELGYLLREYQKTHPGILDKTLSEEYVRTADSRRRADRVLWIGLGRTPNRHEDMPAIVVEFVSATRRDQVRDYITKREEYLAAGVREYWVIDRFRRTMTVFRAGTDSVLVVQEMDVYHAPLLPGFDLPLKNLLKVADDWQDLAELDK